MMDRLSTATTDSSSPPLPLPSSSSSSTTGRPSILVQHPSSSHSIIPPSSVAPHRTMMLMGPPRYPSGMGGAIKITVHPDNEQPLLPLQPPPHRNHSLGNGSSASISIPINTPNTGNYAQANNGWTKEMMNNLNSTKTANVSHHLPFVPPTSTTTSSSTNSSLPLPPPSSTLALPNTANTFSTVPSICLTPPPASSSGTATTTLPLSSSLLSPFVSSRPLPSGPSFPPSRSLHLSSSSHMDESIAFMLSSSSSSSVPNTLLGNDFSSFSFSPRHDPGFSNISQPPPFLRTPNTGARQHMSSLPPPATTTTSSLLFPSSRMHSAPPPFPKTLTTVLPSSTAVLDNMNSTVHSSLPSLLPLDDGLHDFLHSASSVSLSKNSTLSYHSPPSLPQGIVTTTEGVFNASGFPVPTFLSPVAVPSKGVPSNGNGTQQRTLPTLVSAKIVPPLKKVKKEKKSLQGYAAAVSTTSTTTGLSFVSPRFGGAKQRSSPTVRQKKKRNSNSNGEHTLSSSSSFSNESMVPNSSTVSVPSVHPINGNSTNISSSNVSPTILPTLPVINLNDSLSMIDSPATLHFPWKVGKKRGRSKGITSEKLPRANDVPAVVTGNSAVIGTPTEGTPSWTDSEPPQTLDALLRKRKPYKKRYPLPPSLSSSSSLSCDTNGTVSTSSGNNSTGIDTLSSAMNLLPMRTTEPVNGSMNIGTATTDNEDRAKNTVDINPTTDGNARTHLPISNDDDEMLPLPTPTTTTRLIEPSVVQPPPVPNPLLAMIKIVEPTGSILRFDLVEQLGLNTGLFAGSAASIAATNATMEANQAAMESAAVAAAMELLSSSMSSSSSGPTEGLNTTNLSAYPSSFPPFHPSPEGLSLSSSKETDLPLPSYPSLPLTLPLTLPNPSLRSNTNDENDFVTSVIRSIHSIDNHDSHHISSLLSSSTSSSSSSSSTVTGNSNGFLGGLLENVHHPFHVPNRPRIISRHLYGIMALIDESISPTPSPVLHRIGVYTVLLPSVFDPYYAPTGRDDGLTYGGSSSSVSSSSSSRTRSSTHSLRNKETNLQDGNASNPNPEISLRLTGTRLTRLQMWMVKRSERNWSKEAMVRYPHRADVVSRRLREQGRFS